MMKANGVTFTCFILGLLFAATTEAFSSLPPPLFHSNHHVTTKTRDPPPSIGIGTANYYGTQLNVIGRLLRRGGRKKQVRTLEKEDTKQTTKRKKEKDPMWRVMLYSTEYQPDIVAKILASVIPVLDKRVGFELCTMARSMGKVPLVVTRKKEAEVYCVLLQKYGLPVTIEPHDVER